MSEIQILEKVRKILAKTTDRGATEAEAQSAFLLAQELLSKHGMTMEDTENYQPELAEIVRMMDKGNEGTKWQQKFRYPLSAVIARNFRCERYKKGRAIIFIGHAEDVAVCREVYNAAYEFVYREAWRRQRKIYEETGKGEGVVNAYALGFIQGLKNAFDVQCKALMVVTPPEVTEAMDKICQDKDGKPSKAQRNVGLTVTDHTTQILREGYHDGQTFMNGERVGGAG